MSQSDYIAHKKNANLLLPNNASHLGNVLSSQVYTGFKTFELPNTISDETITHNQLQDPTKQTIFGMEMDVSGNCPSYTLCKNTHTRPNRVLQMGNILYDGTPRMTNFTTSGNSTSKDGYYWSLKSREQLCLGNEFKQCDEYYYRRRIWFKSQ